MSLNPDGAPAGFSYQAGATAYLIDPAGAYSLAGASAPTTDPAGTDGGAGASAPTLAAAGASIPITGATSAAAEIVDPAGAYSPAGASAPTTDPARAGAGASAPTLAAAGASCPSDRRGGDCRPRRGLQSGAAATTRDDRPGRRRHAQRRRRSPRRRLFRSGGDIRRSATTPIPPAHSGASAPTLAAPGASIPVTEATFAAAKIVAPPGTYLPPGATAPIADPGGTYSAAGATAPTTDPAGTYSSPYALNRLFLEWKKTTPANVVLSFHSVTAVENYYGATSSEASLAQEFFATNYGNTSATMLFTRIGLGQRPHLLGATLSNLTLTQLQSINGSLALTFDGYTYSGHVNLAGVTSLLDAAADDKGSPQSQFASRSRNDRKFDRAGIDFVHGIHRQSPSLRHVGLVRQHIEIGGVVSGHGIRSGAQIIEQLSGTPGGVGEYSLFSNSGTVSTPEAMKETYGVLTVGTVDSGTVAVGQEVTGARR